MCGLVGVASATLTQEDLKFLRDALICDTLRGEHSTGVAALSQDEVYIHKQVGGGHAFVKSQRYEAMETEATARARQSKDVILMGHNRFATMGTVSRKTAHPFRHNHIVGMHNGTLDWHEHLTTPVFDVDSEAIIYALSTTDDPHTVLEDLPGAFALTWFDTKANTLNIARNHERKLCVAISKDDSTIAWASEEGMLVWLLNRTYKNRKFTYQDMPVGEHWVIPFTNVIKPLAAKVVHEFKPSIERYTYNYGNAYGNAFGGNVQYGSYTKGDLGVGSDYDGAEPRLYPNNMMLPKTVAIATTERVADAGMAPGGEVGILITEFRYYNKYNIYGKGYGHLVLNPQIKVEVNCTDREFASNAPATATLPDYFSQRDGCKIVLCRCLKVSTALTHLTPAHAAIISGDLPGKKWINTASGAIEESRLKLLLSDGCSWCSSDLSLSDASTTTIDDHAAHPTVLCESCLKAEPWKGENYAG